MFGIKTLIKKRMQEHFSSYVPAYTFPEKGIPLFYLWHRLRVIKNSMKQKDIFNNLGWLYTIPHDIAIASYKYFLGNNPNHLGNWSIKKTKATGTQILEMEVINKMIHLYKGNPSTIEGYITSGASEATLYSTWVGKKYLEQFCHSKEICLVKTNLTHHSAAKFSDMMQLNEFITPLNSVNWNIDKQSLIKTIEEAISKGYKGFILPLTLGYPQTGTCDDINTTAETIKTFRTKHKNIHFFVWIDAAFNGLIVPFIDNHFSPFSSRLIQSIAVDFHKFGLVPYSAGIILYRKKLRKLIEKSIDYLPEKDNTVLGSRSGLPAVSIWAMIHALGIKGYKNLICVQLANKDFFIRSVKTILPKTQIITNANSLSCGVIFHSLKNDRLPIYLEQTYGLYAKRTEFLFQENETKTYTIYKFYFLPHVTKSILEQFVRNLDHYVNYSK